MSNVDGTFDTLINTPMGVYESKLTINSDGDKFTGHMEWQHGRVEIEDGAVADNKLTWSTYITQPMPMTLQYKVEVDGDSLEGHVSLGMYGNAPVKGTRVAN